ncbi:helix-turn-helix transcriptional regulator [Puniceicoccales bacterium CK1056]|uniref:Helix-turn-helix transcriptional regulator n=1 Tax=Oceanipulchritudo coccoides TaxID=2706888 RepID=A0A6B2M2B4_9BACT|nr:helix-turn-helix transcriptional regulator [Oceanipulchritudo coccoides]NDV63151.1 helix-turn-helix transcriptional regulator [Oceanipulchritudo coccoides]
MDLGNRSLLHQVDPFGIGEVQPFAKGARTDLQDLAASLGVSYSKFRALFKSQTGYSPREFEIRIKLNRASEMLQSGMNSVSDTSEELGYSSVYYFSRAFKQQFGKSPREWARSSHRKAP